MDTLSWHEGYHKKTGDKIVKWHTITLCESKGDPE